MTEKEEEIDTTPLPTSSRPECSRQEGLGQAKAGNPELHLGFPLGRESHHLHLDHALQLPNHIGRGLTREHRGVVLKLGPLRRERRVQLSALQPLSHTLTFEFHFPKKFFVLSNIKV